jgi:hypothetical protein
MVNVNANMRLAQGQASNHTVPSKTQAATI